LTAQHDHYLPLKVIKAQLDAQLDGELPEARSAYGVPRLVPVGPEGTAEDAHDTAAVAPAQVRLSREDLLTRSGVDPELLKLLSPEAMILAPSVLATPQAGKGAAP